MDILQGNPFFSWTTMDQQARSCFMAVTLTLQFMCVYMLLFRQYSISICKKSKEEVLYCSLNKKKNVALKSLWLRGIENGIENQYFSKYRIEV